LLWQSYFIVSPAGGLQYEWLYTLISSIIPATPFPPPHTRRPIEWLRIKTSEELRRHRCVLASVVYTTKISCGRKFIYSNFFSPNDLEISGRNTILSCCAAERGPPTISNDFHRTRFPRSKRIALLTRCRHAQNIIFYTLTTELWYAIYAPRVQHVPLRLINILLYYMCAIDAIKLQRKIVIQHTHTHTHTRLLISVPMYNIILYHNKRFRWKFWKVEMSKGPNAFYTPYCCIV